MKQNEPIQCFICIIELCGLEYFLYKTFIEIVQIAYRLVKMTCLGLEYCFFDGREK